MKNSMINFQAAYQALRDGCVLAQRDEPDILQLLGEDRLRFLNGQVTCDVAALVPGSGVYGFFTTAKGHIQADVAVLALADRLWLLLPAGLGEEIRERLQKYIIIDRVEVQPLTGWTARTLAGPTAAVVAAELGAVDVPIEPWSHRSVSSVGHWVREGRLGIEALTLWLPVEAAAATDAAIEQAGLVAAPPAVLETVRVEAGEPRFGLDFGPDNLPQETGIDEAVSYTKGCYLGQEIVARLHYRGQVSRQLCGLSFDLAAEQAPPAPGTQLLLDERAAGTVRSVVQSPAVGRTVGFGLLQRRAIEPGTRLQVVGGGLAEVRATPFVSQT